MVDPHVVALAYRIEFPKDITYANPPAVCVENAEFEGALKDGIFVVRMRAHYPDVQSAKAVVNPYLRGWEISSGLSNGGRPILKFCFTNAEVIDRAPVEHQSTQMHADILLEAVTLTATCDAHLTKANYPEPPKDFVMSPLLETLWNRYERYCQGRETLYGMAYFCFTAIVYDEPDGAVKKAASKYNIDRAVLGAITNFSSNLGGTSEGRKKQEGKDLVDATPAEYTWLQAVVPAIIRQVGAVNAGVLPARLTMAMLPALQ